MGKVTGFLEFERAERKYAPVAERVKHWHEFVQALSEEETKVQAARCMDCGIPYCHTGCPVNNQIPDWNDLVFHSDWKQAAQNLHSTNNFPEVTGRVCPAPCEASCTLNIDDVPVAIKTIECAIADRAFDEGWIAPQPPERKTGKRIAIVGSGPAGMAAAQQLARAGHDVHVYEKNAKPGGLLRYGIPDFKMEKGVIDRRVKQMEAEGVTFHCNAHVGNNVSAAELEAEYDALLMAGGSEQPFDFFAQLVRPRSRRHPLRHGFPAAAEPPRRRRDAAGDHRRQGDLGEGQARHRHRRRRHRLGLHRHVVPSGRQVGDAARDHADAAGAREQGAVVAQLAAEAAHLHAARPKAPTSNTRFRPPASPARAAR